MKLPKDQNQITRKEALKKMGKYAAITAVSTFIVLNPMKSQANTDPGGGGGFTPPSD